MNKTYLVVGGVAVTSLAAGAASGYLFAKKRFNDKLPELISHEVEETKKHYSLLLMEARSGKPSSPGDILSQEETEQDQDESSEDDAEEELSEQDQAVIAKGRQILAEAANSALTNYQGYSKPNLSEVSENNVFATAEKTKRKPPPRGGDGKFRKKTVREKDYGDPQIVDQETYLVNDEDFNQETLLYFVNDKTLVMEADTNEVVLISQVGEVNLTLFPETSATQESMIYVRNPGLSTYYEVKRMEESLTSYIGLGDSSEEEELDDAAYL